MKFKLTACVLALALCLSGCSGGADAPTEDPSSQPSALATAQNLTLGYTPGDGFNPYLASSTLVLQNSGLLFEKLVEITPDMGLAYRTAQNIQTSGTSVLISMNGSCTFADGSYVTANDAAASLLAAKASSLYAGRFANVEKVEVQDNSVLVTLYAPDSLFAYLCDIPVFKADETAAKKPTASGRYTYGENNTLVRNGRAAFPENGPAVIQLTEVSGYDEMVSGLAMGTPSLYTTGDDTMAGGGSNVSRKETSYKTNALIYLGINAESEKPLLQSAAGRSLLSRLLDRRSLAEKSYYSRAYPATGVINSFYPCVSNQQVILSGQDTEGADDVLVQLGYTKNAVSGFYEDADGVRLSVELLVYAGNTYKRYSAALIKEQLAAQGIEVNVTAQNDFDSYTQAVTDGQFELYMGEIKLYNNMDLSPFWSGAASAHLLRSESILDAYHAFRENQGAAGTFEQVFAAEMPFVPLLWRCGIVVTTPNVSGVSSSLSNIFYSVEGLSMVSGS